MVAALHAPVAAAQPQQLRRGALAGPQTGGVEAGFVGGLAGFLLGGDAAQRQHLSGQGEVDLLRSDCRHGQLAVLGAAVTGVVGGKKRGDPLTACAAACST